MSTDTQAQQILNWLKQGRGITPMEALRRFNCFRLSGRVYDLRKQGHKIKTQRVTVGKKQFARYRLA